MMNRHLSLCLLLVCVYPATSFSQISFARTYGGDAWDEGLSVQQTNDGGYVISGRTDSFGAGGSDVYLIRTDSSGNALWARFYGGNENDDGRSIQQTADGGYVIVGHTESFGAGGSDVYLIKTDSSGDTLWTRSYGGNQNDDGRSVQQTADGGYVMAGHTESFGAGGSDIYLIKTDSSGDTLWTRSYGGDENEYGQSVQQTADGGYVITGYTESYGAGYSDTYLIRTDSTGDTLWTRTMGGDSWEVGYSVQQTIDGGYVIVGSTESFGAGYSDVYLIRTDSVGDTLWTRTYGGYFWEVGYSVQQTADGGYVITGGTWSFGDDYGDVYLIRTDSSGDTLWTRTFGSNGDADVGYSIQQTADGGYITAGSAEQLGEYWGDVYLIKTDPDGNVGISDNKPPSLELPRSWALSQNYPNPFNPSTTFSFDVPGITAMRQHVTLTVYDMRGQLVRTLLSSEIEPGNHCVTWDGKDESGKSVSSGIYLYALRAGEERFTRKMVILK
jgi:hypothetical protein